MKVTNNVLIIIFLIIFFPSIISAREGLRGTISYTYEDKVNIDHFLNKKVEESYFLQKYNLDWNKKYLLEKGTLGTFDASFSLGYNVLDKWSNIEDERDIESFNNRWFLNLIITPAKMPLYFEALTERADVTNFDTDFDKTNYKFTHHMITFKYVMPKYFYLYDPRFRGNGNGNGNGFGNGNGNGMFWGGNGNGNGMFWGGNGNGGLLGGNGNGNGNGGFFSGNGNGFGNGNGNGGSFLKRRIGSLTPYAYLFSWNSYRTDSDNIVTSKLDIYTLNLGFLKFWINTNYEEFNDSDKLLIEFGQRKYDGSILWTIVSNWISSASYFVYEKNESNNKTNLERYEGNFLFKTYRSNWYSNLPTRLTYYDKNDSKLFELRAPFYFYGTMKSLNTFSGALTYDYDKNVYKFAKSFSKNRITNNFGTNFNYGNWKVNSRHDLVLFFDDLINSTDYITFNYKIDLNQPLTLDKKYVQNGGYEITLNKNLENDQNLFQVHTANYGILYSGIEKTSLSINESLSYYDKGSIPVNSNDYISQRRVVDVKIEPKNRSLRNTIMLGVSYNPMDKFSVNGNISNDTVFYSSGEEMKNTYNLTAEYRALERKMILTGEGSYYTLDRLADEDENSARFSLKISYTPTYNLRSVTSYSYTKTEYLTSNKETFDSSLSEEITYTYYYGKLKAKKLFDLRGYAKLNRYKNKDAIVADSYQGTGLYNVPKTLLSYEGNLVIYPHRFFTVGGNIKKEYFKEDTQSEYNENMVYTINASLNFPLLSISAFYQEINKRIEAKNDERRFNISLTKRF